MKFPNSTPSHAAGPPSRRLSATILALALGVVLGCTAVTPNGSLDAFAQDGSLDQMSNKACDAYRQADFEKALSLSRQELKSVTDPQTRIDIYKCQACTYVAMAEIDPAKGSISGMLSVDSGARFSPDYSYPPPVIDLYHAVRESLFAGTVDINTVAVGDFEDNSVYIGKFKDYDFSLFERGLIHTITADLAMATPLKIVDRQRTSQILKEIELGQSGFVSADDAVKFGQLLGAQSFIFGQYMILSKNTVRIDARVVKTSTGEIILTKSVTGEFAGKPEKFLELQRELITALAGGIDQVIAGGGERAGFAKMTDDYFEGQASNINKRDGYVEGYFLTAKALELEDAGNYTEAKKIWQQIRKVDPNNDVAAVRLDVLDTFAMK